MPQATALREKWVSVSTPSPQSAVRLVCLPHAGTSVIAPLASGIVVGMDAYGYRLAVCALLHQVV